MKIHKVNINKKTVFISQREETFKVVKPWKNEDGSINWFNFLTGGSWLNFWITLIIVIVVLGTLYEYSQNMQMFLNCFQVPGMLNDCMEAFGNGSQLIIYP